MDLVARDNGMLRAGGAFSPQRLQQKKKLLSYVADSDGDVDGCVDSDD
jgi:hypothetical protein